MVMSPSASCRIVEGRQHSQSMRPGKARRLANRHEYRSRTGPTSNTAELGIVQASAVNASHPQSDCTRDITSYSYIFRQSLRTANTYNTIHRKFSAPATMVTPTVLNSENVKAASMIGIARRTKYCASGRFVSSAAVNASTKLRTIEPDVRICRPKRVSGDVRAWTQTSSTARNRKATANMMTSVGVGSPK